jgi:hypothetical protein
VELYFYFFFLKACDTFLKIATKCKIDLAIPKEGEPAYILYIAKDLPNIIGDLENQQASFFWEIFFARFFPLKIRPKAIASIFHKADFTNFF